MISRRALRRFDLKHQRSQKHTEDKYDQENRERNIKEYFGYPLGACRNFCEPKETRNNGNDEENDGPLDHECSPWSWIDASLALYHHLKSRANCVCNLTSGCLNRPTFANKRGTIGEI